MLMELSISDRMFNVLTRAMLCHPDIEGGYMPSWNKFGQNLGYLTFKLRVWYDEESSTVRRYQWDVNDLFDTYQWLLNHTKLDDGRVSLLKRWYRAPHEMDDSECVALIEWLADSYTEMQKVTPEEIM